jgi:hypothetical protein
MERKKSDQEGKKKQRVKVGGKSASLAMAQSGV